MFFDQLVSDSNRFFMTEERKDEDKDKKGEVTHEGRQELILAIQSKDIKRISQLLEHGMSVHSSGKKTRKIQLNQTSEPFLEVWYL